MPKQKPKKQTRDQDRLEMVLKECGPFLIPCDLSAMFEAIPGDPIYCGPDQICPPTDAGGRARENNSRIRNCPDFGC